LSLGNGQPREPALCQLSRYPLVPCSLSDEGTLTVLLALFCCCWGLETSFFSVSTNDLLQRGRSDYELLYPFYDVMYNLYRYRTRVDGALHLYRHASPGRQVCQLTRPSRPATAARWPMSHRASPAHSRRAPAAAAMTSP